MMHQRILFLHGLESSSQARKARYLREIYGDAVVAPDWRVSRRLSDCRQVILKTVQSYRNQSFVVVGSSMGGFMASICAADFSTEPVGLIYVNPVVSLTPLIDPYFDDTDRFKFQLHDVPTTLLLGKGDTVCPPDQAIEVFTSTARIVLVDDDHGLGSHYRRIAKEIDRFMARARSSDDQIPEKDALRRHSRQVLIDGDQ